MKTSKKPYEDNKVSHFMYLLNEYRNAYLNVYTYDCNTWNWWLMVNINKNTFSVVILHLCN